MIQFIKLRLKQKKLPLFNEILLLYLAFYQYAPL